MTGNASRHRLASQSNMSTKHRQVAHHTACSCQASTESEQAETSACHDFSVTDVGPSLSTLQVSTTNDGEDTPQTRRVLESPPVSTVAHRPTVMC